MNVPSDPILVVDDVDANRDMLARRLARLGYRVEEASSGQDALAYLALYSVSAVLLDIEMPGMSGIDVLRAIRVTWTPAQLPVLMVTARDQNEDIVAALDLGANDYITKPLNFPVALARLRTQLCLKDAEDRLRASEERYALAAKGANDGLWDWDLLTGQFYYSNRWKAIIGYEDEGVGSGPDEWFGRVHSEDLPRLHRDLDAHLSGATPHFENEHRMRHKSGSFRWVLTRGLAVRDRDGRPIRMAGSQSDITEGKVVDALTGLPNRMLLVDRLERALHQHRSMGSVRPAVLFIDLDGFKFVNDSFGHLYGDELLQAVARRFESSLRYSDTVSRSSAAEHTVLAEHTLARVGGDEFVILLPDVRDIVDATRVAERIQRVLTRPFNIGGRDVFTTASIGIAMSSGTQARPEDLLRDADTAMYRAKALGKGRCEVFDAAMREQVLERVRLDTALRQGLERHEFLPYFQPIVKLDTGELAGFEALLRWRQPDGTIVRPGTFVSMIEENGLVVPIGTKFIADVCRQFRMWQDEDPSARLLSIDVNFASLQLMESGLLDKLLGLLSHTGLEPAHLVIEITETTAIGNFDQASEVLGRMRNAGIRVMLDDFGTGYSSLSCLHELPICGIKLDRSFINRTHRHPAILPAILRLADQLDLTVVAEGVEAVEQWQELRSLGCDLAQGFLFARPMDAEAAGALLRERRVWQPQAATSSSVA